MVLFQIILKANKQVLVLAIFMLMIEVSKKNNVNLLKIPYIYYLIQFKKTEIQALINFDSKINIMPFAYIAKLGPKI